jgi:hypothetical protein
MYYEKAWREIATLDRFAGLDLIAADEYTALCARNFLCGANNVMNTRTVSLSLFGFCVFHALKERGDAKSDLEKSEYEVI